MKNRSNPMHPGAVTALVATGLCMAALSACTLGPDFVKPLPVTGTGYSSEPLPAADASTLAFTPGSEIAADWWRVFQCPPLDGLIQRALAANPTIPAARAALRQAQELVKAQQGAFLPTLDGQYTFSRTQLSGNTGGNSPGLQGNGTVISTGQTDTSPPASTPVTYNFHTAQLTVGFVPDLFGGNRRQVEALAAQGEATALELQAANITLAANVAGAAIQDGALRDQIDAVQHLVEANRHSLDIVRRQRAAGYASGLDEATQQSALAQAEAQLPPLQLQLAQNRDLLHSLLGLPQDAPLPETFALRDFTLPATLPLSLPAQLVQQRPDVRIAEANLHAASAQVGVATAALLPQINISADAGGNASVFSQMFDPSGRFFGLTAGITQPLFEGGSLLHRKRASEQGLIQAEAQYRSAVLTALQNVADSLQAIAYNGRTVQAAKASEAAARHLLVITQQQRAAGYVAPLAELVADINLQQSRLAALQAAAAQLSSTVALYQALGGGWWNAAPAAQGCASADNRPAGCAAQAAAATNAANHPIQNAASTDTPTMRGSP
jgi:NodT family efflux transporter outer membrane factor (OMF) lipoprotein